ncbi:MAG: DnaB-like helicase N-terminal domain-containing protein, partial [Beijerinckiaceae bacterium]
MQNEIAEENIIGMVMRQPELLPLASAILSPDDFENKLASALFARALELRKARRKIAAASMAHELQEKFQETIPVWLARVAKEAPADLSIEEIADLVLDASVKRQVADMCQKLLKRTKMDADVRDLLSSTIDQATALTGRIERPSVSIATVANNIVAAALGSGDEQPVPALYTSMSFIDRPLGGMMPKDFIVLGAATSMGKSSLGFQIAVQVARQGIPVLHFAIEPSKEEAVTAIL